MGLAKLLKAGWRNLVTSPRMDKIGLLAMSQTAKSRMAECIYLFIYWRNLSYLLMGEPILSFNGGTSHF